MSANGQAANQQDPKDARILELTASQHQLRQKVAFLSDENSELRARMEAQRAQHEAVITELKAALANNGLRTCG